MPDLLHLLLHLRNGLYDVHFLEQIETSDECINLRLDRLRLRLGYAKLDTVANSS